MMTAIRQEKSTDKESFATNHGYYSKNRSQTDIGQSFAWDLRRMIDGTQIYSFISSAR